MDLQRLTIGQMAQLNHISEQTLRLYDKEGLLKAQEVDLKSGYRYYHILQSARLDLIQNLKMYGLTLKQIKDILSSNHLESIKDQLEYQEKDIDFYQFDQEVLANFHITNEIQLQKISDSLEKAFDKESQ